MPDALCAANVHDCRKEAEMNTQKVTILYQRLSVDDDRDGESNSIQNQRRLLEEFAERNNLTPYINISDDGVSGTRFDRPGWERVIEEIEAGRVLCLCIKDLSRMGRDYLRVGLYMEMFREKGIRLIAVNDGIDTSRGEDDFTPFRAIMAEWYARDCSRKIKSSLNTKGRDGKPLANTPPYGFIKDPNDKNKWLVDSEAAAVVRRIYNLTVEGKGPYEICRILHSEKVERPSYYLAKHELHNSNKALEADDPFRWRGHVVANILSKPEYCGHTVNFRTTKTSYKKKHSEAVSPDEWLIFKSTHEAIIPQETWDLVQTLRQTVRRTDSTGEANPLTGLMFCSDCGAKMYNHRSKRDSYSCSTHHLGKQYFKQQCSGHYVSTAAVRTIILDVLRRTGSYIKEHEAEFVEQLREDSAVRQGETVKSYKRQIAKNERRIAELDKLFCSIYEDKVKGVLSDERFAMMSVGYEQEQTDLRAQTATMQSEIDVFNADGEKADRFIELIQRYTRFEVLTTPMINELIEKIVVHEGAWSEQNDYDSRRGTRTQQIEVYLKYIGKFDVPETKTPKEIEAELILEEKREKERKRKREYNRRVAAERKAAEAARNPKPAA